MSLSLECETSDESDQWLSLLKDISNEPDDVDSLPDSSNNAKSA